MKILKKKYKGLGFVEALIAISVSGIVGVVLMSISISTLQKLRQLDMQDVLATHAVSTAVDLQKIAMQDMTLANDEKQLSTGNLLVGSCYGFTSVGGELRVDSNNAFSVESRSRYMDLLVDPNDEDSEYFRMFCVRINETSKMIVNIVVGSNKVDGLATTDDDVKDYEYIAVINK